MNSKLFLWNLVLSEDAVLSDSPDSAVNHYQYQPLPTVNGSDGGQGFDTGCCACELISWLERM